MTRVLVPLANGVEEMEAVIVIDVLRRAQWQVTAAGLDGLEIKASRGVRLLADVLLKDVNIDDHDILVIPGGKDGVEALLRDRRIPGLVNAFSAGGRLVCAICAGPLVLQAAGILANRRATCRPAVRERLTVPLYTEDRVATDGRIITSRGPGTAIEFALAIVEVVEGNAAAGRIADGLVI